MHTVKIPPAADIAFVRAALKRLALPEVALEWPLGAAGALASASAMQALVELCATLPTDVIVIGGDESLRAYAVAAGFPAATSLAEWETSKQRAIRPRRPTRILARRRDADADHPPIPGPYLVRPASEETDAMRYNLAGEDPPAYVVELLIAGQAAAPANRLTAVPTIPLRKSRGMTRQEELRQEAAAVAARERQQQAYEERITTAIRGSADLGGNGDPAPRPDDPSTDPPPNTPTANA